MAAQREDALRRGSTLRRRGPVVDAWARGASSLLGAVSNEIPCIAATSRVTRRRGGGRAQREGSDGEQRVRVAGTAVAALLHVVIEVDAHQQRFFIF